MELILIRHGEPVVAQRDDAPVDPELTTRGRWQAERVAEWLAVEPIDHIVTSAKRRAIETAAPLARRLSVASEVVHDFDEIDRYARVYAPFDQLQERFPEYLEAAHRGDWEAIGWDPPDRFRERVMAAYEELLARRPGSRVAIACHGGVIGVIAGHVLGLDSRGILGHPPFASITRIAIADQQPAQLLSLNEVGHFDATRSRVIGPDGPGFD